MRKIAAIRELSKEWKANGGLRAGTVGLALTLAGVFGATAWTVAADRQELVRRFESEREAQLTDVAGLVEGKFSDIHDDLELTARLAYNVYPEQQEAIIMALLGAVKGYRAAALVDAQGGVKLVSDPRVDEELSPVVRDAVVEAGKQAIVRGTYVSPRVGEDDSWFRAFGQVVPSGQGAFVVLADTREFLDDIKVLASDPATLVVVLGPQGRFAPVTSEVVLAHADDPSVQALLAQMVAQDRGSYRLTWSSSGWTGFERGDVVVAYRRINALPNSHWSVATLTSLSAIRSHEAALTNRLLSFAAFVTVLLVGFGLYLIVSTRRTAGLRERLRTASELAHLNQKADTILQTIPMAVCVIDQEGRVTAANSAWHREFQVARGESLTSDNLGILSPVVEAAMRGESGDVFSEDEELLGSLGSFHAFAVPFVPGADDARVLLVVEDVSQMRRLEAQLVRAEKLSTVGVLAAGIAHEIGTPLGVVRGRAEYILGKTQDESSHAKGLRVIIDQIDRVSRIIQELLDFSRTEAVSTTRVPLAPVLAKIQELLRAEITSRQITWDVDVPADLPALAADPDRLEQVLVNLLVNARDALEGCDTRQIVVRAEAGDGEVCVSVQDTGKGIAADDLPKIFDPFYSTKKRGQGTGLGLAVVAQIVRSHRGRIEVSSEPEVGTRFDIHWPVYQSKE